MYVIIMTDQRNRAKAKAKKGEKNMIKWKATSVNGLVKYEQESKSFKELFDELDEMGIISDPDFPLYDTALLEKYGKSFSDNDFKDETGELDYEKVENFLDGKKLSDRELYELILSRNGEAYYQKFIRETENKILEIEESDFDETGKYKF